MTTTAIDLSTWFAETISRGVQPVWALNTVNDVVVQTENAVPSFFCDPNFSAQGKSISGKIKVLPKTLSFNDDDFIGFALGFNQGDLTNTSADYLLIDWKQSTQSFDFPGDCTPQGTAFRGLALSRVTGIPTADEIWQHADCACNVGAGLEELARGITLANQGWADLQEYTFTYAYTPTSLKVWVVRHPRWYHIERNNAYRNRRRRRYYLGYVQ